MKLLPLFPAFYPRASVHLRRPRWQRHCYERSRVLAGASFAAFAYRDNPACPFVFPEDKAAWRRGLERAA